MLEILPVFKISYPEYSVITPQTNREYTMRSLSVQDEEKFKSSSLAPNQFAGHLNTILWECIVKKPDDIKTFDDFKAKTTLRDREALLYALYHVSYKDINDFDAHCAKCDRNYPVKIDISTCFSMERYIPSGELLLEEKVQNERVDLDETPVDANPEIEEKKSGPKPKVIKEKPAIQIDYNELINKKIALTLSVANNITVFIKQPTLLDEEIISKNPLFQSTKMQSIGTELMIVDRFEIIPDASKPDSREKAIITQLDNKYILYTRLPSQDRKLITKTYIDNFAKYSISLKVDTVCQFCGEQVESSINLIEQFFRAL